MKFSLIKTQIFVERLSKDYKSKTESEISKLWLYVCYIIYEVKETNV